MKYIFLNNFLENLKLERFFYLWICNAKELLCSVHRSFSPLKPLIIALATSIFRLHISASFISPCRYEYKMINKLNEFTSF